MKKAKTGKIIYTTLIFVIVILLFITLAFQYTANTVTNPTFFIAFGVLGVASFFFALASLIIHVLDGKWKNPTEEELSETFYASKKNPIFVNLATKIFVIIMLILLTSGGVLFLGSLIGVPNPYDATTLSKSVLDQHSTFLNLWNTSVYPGWFEELPIFGLINILIFLSLLGLGAFFKNKNLRKNLVVIILVSLFCISLGAGLFTAAHSQAYELNSEAYVSAFLFEWVVQAGNQLTGSFISWIPHVFHNALVVYRTQFSVAFGVATPMFIFFFPGFKMLFVDAWIGLKRRLLFDWNYLRGCFYERA